MAELVKLEIKRPSGARVPKDGLAHTDLRIWRFFCSLSASAVPRGEEGQGGAGAVRVRQSVETLSLLGPGNGGQGREIHSGPGTC